MYSNPAFQNRLQTQHWHAKIEQNTHIIYSHKYSMDNKEEDKIVQLALLTINALVAASLTVASFGTSRPASIIEKRLDWNLFVEKYAEGKDFSRHLRMPLASFNKLVDCIGDGLVVDETMASLRGPPISPQLILYATLRFLAGGSYSDIRFLTGISTPSLYRLIWKTIHIINNCDKLQLIFPQSKEEVINAAKGFQTISANGCLWNVATVVDGYHLETHAPPKSHAKNVRSFFSGHYQTYGVNVQAACDHQCRFQFIGIAGPGVMGDREAVNQIELGNLVESLPGIYCAIGDCAYTATEHMVPIFGGAQATVVRHDNFNFFASQLRIRIEMAFGLMVKKWGILQRPITIHMKNIKHLILAIARLHNFCINERLQGHGKHSIFQPQNVDLPQHQEVLRITAANVELRHMDNSFQSPWSRNRDRMVTELEEFEKTRPGAFGRKAIQK